MEYTTFSCVISNKIKSSFKTGEKEKEKRKKEKTGRGGEGEVEGGREGGKEEKFRCNVDSFFLRVCSEVDILINLKIVFIGL